MSNLATTPEAEECRAAPIELPPVEPLPERQVQLGSLAVRRVLPVRGRRLIGPWCFFDRYGPVDFSAGKPMDVAPHPHIGLQTVSWLFSGEVVHNDSLGSECLVRPGHLSLMTAGRGIAHTEETPADNTGRLDGVQLWVALPESGRAGPPEYQCTGQLPSADLPAGRVTTFLGGFAGLQSPGRQFSPGAGAEIHVHPRSTLCLELDPAFEYGVLLASGDASVLETAVRPDRLYYLGIGRREFTASSSGGARLILIGGPPFGETILMWWNFVARTQEEMTAARTAWEDAEAARALFGAVPRYRGPRLAAPSFLGRPIRS